VGRRAARAPVATPAIDWDEALRLHAEQGWTHVAIARKFGYSAQGVRRGLARRGAKRRRVLRGTRVKKLRELWRFLHEKCSNPANHSFRLYGAKGARVAEAWKTFEPFYDWALGENYRVGLRLARRDETRPFGPENCAWVTVRERLRLRMPPREPKSARKKARPIDWSVATRLRVEEGLSPAEVARRLGASYMGILDGFKRLGIARSRPRPTSTPEGRRLYKVWSSIHARCEDKAHPLYPYNGARGARVCAEWAEVEPFLSWAKGSGARSGLWLARIDRDANYSAQNCEWVTAKEALRRRRPPTKKPPPKRLIRAFGETQGLSQWAKDPRCVVGETAIARRLARGWGAKRALTTPAEHPGASEMIWTELRAFGERKGVTAWARDRRCRIGRHALVDRLRRGWAAEEALTTLPHRLPANGERSASDRRQRGESRVFVPARRSARPIDAAL